ncbi:MAG: hypothetical protein U9P80_00125, partial [Thermodesulfobacteriota bacterium]|nr:hypothetical protein [Thermodesulfobacteriota bacterium]
SLSIGRDVDLVLDGSQSWEAALDTPADLVLDPLFNIYNFLISALEDMSSVDMTSSYITLANILEQVIVPQEGEPLFKTKGISSLEMNDDYMAFDLVVKANAPQNQKATYATPENNNGISAPSPDYSGYNSLTFMSDDLINRALGCYFTGYTIDETIDMNALIEELTQSSDIEAWPWLKKLSPDGDVYPGLDLHIGFPTPPVILVDAASAGILKLRDIKITASMYDSTNKKDVCLFRLSMDRDLKITSSNGVIGLELDQFPFIHTLFNRLDPLLLPKELSHIETVLSAMLSQTLQNMGLLGLELKEIGFDQTGYVSIQSRVNARPDLSAMATHNYTAADLALYNPDSNTPDLWAAWLRNMTSGDFADGWLPGEENSIHVDASGIVFDIQDARDLYWKDSTTFQFNAPKGEIITGISFDPAFSNLNKAGFAALCVTRDSLVDSTSARDFSPCPEIAVPWEIAPTTDELGRVSIYTGPCTGIGVSLRIKKKPGFLSSGSWNPEQLRLDIFGITVHTVDMNLDLME